MPKRLPAIVERFEGVAANVLEDMIAQVEDQNHVKVLEVLVDVVHGETSEPPSVNVSVSIEPPKSNAVRV